MKLLLDTSLWIDFTRTRSPRALKAFIAPCEAIVAVSELQLRRLHRPV